MIDKFEARPYLLKNSIQNYAWGTKGEDAFIPRLVGVEAQNDTPYAELWIGAHPKAPSYVKINDEGYPLNELIKQFPEEILGNHIIEKFGNTLPYLLKVLSINQALSIQVHPSKQLAGILHKKDPQNYPDDNHKPEIAVAIDSLQAIVGFKPVDEIRNILNTYPALKELVGNEIYTLFNSEKRVEENDLLKQLYSAVMLGSEERLSECVEQIKAHIGNKIERSEEENQFLIQYETYGIDAGLISILIFNMVTLKPGEAIFTKDGVPHAYIKGNIIECMANSDNVVRAGLTPKFKDVETLLDMLTYEGAKPEIILPEGANPLSYSTPAEEFQLTKYSFDKDGTEKFTNNNELLIGLVLKGKVSITSEYSESLVLASGMACLIPASLKEFQFSFVAETCLVLVKVP